jgi:small-conductance mechanosensitive channel
MTSRVAGLALAAMLLATMLPGSIGLADSQAPAPTGGGSPPGTYARVPADQAAVLKVGNRPVITFRAQVLTRSPAERADAASRRIAALFASGLRGPVSQRSVLDVILITVAGQDVFGITPADADELAGETQVEVALTATRQLGEALGELDELRQPARLAREAATAIGFTILLLAALWVLRRVYRAVGKRMAHLAERQFERARLATHVAVDTSRLVFWMQRGIRTLAALLALLAIYLWLVSTLVLFPYTRPLGETLGDFLTRTFQGIGAGILNAVPGLFYVAVIIGLTRLLIRLMQATLDGVAEGRLQVPGIHPETALPTKRLLAALMWLFAVVVSYPYLPGADTDAFKGVSVFLGLVLSLGSSGLVNHMMSGFLLTFTRAVKPGDYIRVGDTEGTVTMVGLLSSKVRTNKGEEVILPNAVAIGGTIVNYSRYASRGELLLYSSVTIGYDTPWRQVEGLLRTAAERTPGMAKNPPPFVLQRALSDFYVEYQVNAVLERPETRGTVLSALHANIQDAFNDVGVQIMSPHYESDPDAPKLAPPGQGHSPSATGVVRADTSSTR